MVAVGDLPAGHQHGDALGELHHRVHDVLDHHDRHAGLVEAQQQGEDLVDLAGGQPGHRLVGDQQARMRRHGAGEFKFAQVDLGQRARALVGLPVQADLFQDLHGVEIGRAHV